MAFSYKTAVPWGRSFDEYRRMFHLSDDDLKLRILGCADGPASFNAILSRNGGSVVSCDPLYDCTTAQIEERIAETYETVIGQTRANQDKFVWETIQSVEELGETRLAAMRDFLKDYETGKSQGRYVTAELPVLPFKSHSFNLALCSHFLFLYSANFSFEFHRKAIAELLRVAKEVRIFPVLDYNAELSPYLQPIMEQLKRAGQEATLETVPYEFQRGGNQMLRILPVRTRKSHFVETTLSVADLRDTLHENVSHRNCVVYRIGYGDCIQCYFEDAENGAVSDIMSWYGDWSLHCNGSLITSSEDCDISFLEKPLNKRVTQWAYHLETSGLTIEFEEGWTLQITPFADNTLEERKADVWILRTTEKSYVSVSSKGIITRQIPTSNGARAE